MQMAGWIVAVALALVKDSERAAVANECRQGGAFVSKRTGFECEVKR
jgi:hypothetical protein